MIKKRAVISEERWRVQSIPFRLPAAALRHSQRQREAGRVQRLQLPLRHVASLHQVPSVNKESARKLDAVECLTPRPDYSAAGRKKGFLETSKTAFQSA